MAEGNLSAGTAAISGLGPLEPRKKGDAAYHAMRRAILLGHLKAGESLTEQRIAGELACSQGTVREALLKLEQDGLVCRRGYRGTSVSATSVTEAIQMLGIRLALESAAFESVARQRPSGLAEELEEIVDQMHRVLRSEDPYLSSELDRRFHLTVMRASGLLALEPILCRCTLHIHRYTYLGADLTSPDARFAERHVDLLAAINSGDGALAAASVRDHIEDVIRTWAPGLAEPFE